MKRKLFTGLLALTLPLLALSGCHHNQPRPCPGPGLQPLPQQLPPGPPPGGLLAPVPKGVQSLPEPPLPPAPVPSQSKSLDPLEYNPELTWKPGSGPSVRLYPPEVVEGQASPPMVVEPKKQEPPQVDDPFKTEPKVQGGTQLKSPVPVGIAQFALVRDGVASGLRPSLDDGLDWLQANGYKTVLHLHAPGESDSADRKLIERRGLKFVSLEVSSQTLSAKVVEEFNELVKAGGPLFVYDRDGSLAGAMWYVHFRTAMQDGDEKARTQANALGLREDREIWSAAQQYFQ